MFLRATVRKKDGKEHTYYSAVENKRLADGRLVQRHVLYLGEINSSRQLAWRKSIEVLDEGRGDAPRTIALFPEDRRRWSAKEMSCGCDCRSCGSSTRGRCLITWCAGGGSCSTSAARRAGSG